MAANQANKEALDIFSSFELITKFGAVVEANKQEYIKSFSQVAQNIQNLQERAISLFYVYKEKVDATMSSRRFLMNQ